MIAHDAFAVLPKAWTQDQEDALAADVCQRLATTRTIKGEFSCDDQALVRHWAQVVQRIHEAHMDVIHTAGTAWEGQTTLRWNFSGWPPKKVA